MHSCQCGESQGTHLTMKPAPLVLAGVQVCLRQRYGKSLLSPPLRHLPTETKKLCSNFLLHPNTFVCFLDKLEVVDARRTLFTP